MSTLIPEAYAHLLERPLYGHLGTIRPDDTVQVNPMWFEFDGEHLRFTHTTQRGEVPQPAAQPLDEPVDHRPRQRVPVPGAARQLVDVEPDPTGAFYVRLGRRYGNAEQQPPPDSADRVILVMSIEKTTKQ